MHTVKTFCKGQGYMQIIMETNSHDTLPRPRVYTDHHGIMETYGRIQIIIMETHTVKTYCWGQDYIHIIIMETHMVKTYCWGQEYIQIVMETHMVKMYCQGQGYIQIIMETGMGQDVLLRPRLYTDHHHGDTYGQDVLPRVYTDHLHGDWYGSGRIAKTKGIYRSSSWRQVWVRTYC